MKTKLLWLTALAIPALFAACADDDFATNTANNTEVNGQFIELGKDFAIGLTRGNGATANTRTAWHYEGGDVAPMYSWLPTFNIIDADNATATVENIGFAWRGEGAGDAKVRTNYKFTLNGFLKKGETAPKTKICDGRVLVMNGYTLERDNKTNDIEVTTSSSKATVNLMEYKDATKQMVASSTYGIAYEAKGYEIVGATATTLPDALDAEKLGEKDPYVRNGIFTTDNSTIFKGDYIVYFPYNSKFAEVDYLPAISPVIYAQDDADKNRAAHLTGKIFGYGVATIAKGGSMAESFDTENLSHLIDIKIKAESSKNVQKIILVDEGENAKGFIKEVGLDASKISAKASGADLYVSGTEIYEPTLVLNLKDSDPKAPKEYAEISTTAKDFMLATLPTTVNTLVAYLMDENGLCCRKVLATGKTLNAGKASRYEVEITKEDKFDQALAVDTKTLIELLDEKGRGTKDATINVLGNISLDPSALVRIGDNHNTATATALNKLFLQGSSSSTPALSIYVKNNITVNGTGTITIPADLNILIKVAGEKTLTFKNPVTIEGQGCCGGKAGQLMLTSPVKGEGTVVFEGAVKNLGEMWLANNAATTSKTKIVFNGTLLNGIDKEYEDKGIIYCAGLMAGNSVIEMNGTVTNEGEIKVLSATKDLASLKVFPFDYSGGMAYPNHESGSVQVSAKAVANTGSIIVGKFTKFSIAGTMVNSGDLTVETANTNKNSEDGELYIANNGSVTNTGLVENFGVINNEGALKNNDAEKAVIVDHVGCQFGGKKAQATPGEYICDVEDTDVTKDGDRLGYAMGDNMPTTTVRFIGKNVNSSGTIINYAYKLNDYKTGDILPYNFIIAAESPIELTTKSGNAITINGKLTVNEGSKLNLSSIQLTVNEVVTVNGEMTISPVGTSAATLESKIAFTAKNNVDVNNIFEVVKFVKTSLEGNLNIAKNAKATFNYATYTDVAKTININGEFVRVVSTGSQTANPAQVWCKDYVKLGDAIIPNGLPQQK